MSRAAILEGERKEEDEELNWKWEGGLVTFVTPVGDPIRLH